MDLNGTTFGSVAVYQCREGLTLNGESTRMCQANGEWSGNEPTCEGTYPGNCVTKSKSDVELCYLISYFNKEELQLPM